MEQIRTYLVDWSRLNREGYRRLLDGTDLAIIGDASDLDGLQHELDSGLDPDCVVLHLDQAKVGVYAFVAAARALIGTARRLVCLTSQTNPEVMREAFAAGTDALLHEDITHLVMVRSLRLVMAGEKVFPSALLAKLLQGNTAERHAGPQSGEPGTQLTRRETEILQSVALGDANKVIANRLAINEATVKTHLKNIQRKLNVNNRTQVAIWALNQGLATPQERPVASSALQEPDLPRPGGDH